jgi:hypothetical protein
MAMWWIFYRKTLDWRAVTMFYFGGVFSVDLLSAGLLVILLHWFPQIPPIPHSVPALGLLMPIGGLGGLAYGAASGKMRKMSERIRSKAAVKPEIPPSSQGAG